MSSDEKNAVNRILKAKIRQPEHKRLDIKPSIGGSSLLHDEFGMPNVGNTKRREQAPLKEINNDPVSIKAFVPNDKISYKKPNSPKIGLDFEPAAKDDDFLPPKSNFVAIGHVEHSWYDEKVTGPSSIDNNEMIDTEALQGIDPLDALKNVALNNNITINYANNS